MFAETLLILALLSLAVFAVPLRLKGPFTLAVTGIGALRCLAESIAVLGRGYGQIETLITSPVFGDGYAATDPLSALFMLICSLAVIAVLIYAQGYLRPYLGKKSPAQLSLHYAALSLLYYAMIGVVMCRGAFGFLFMWELMTVSSFVLILFDAERREVRRAAMNYLILMHIGFIFLVAGFVTLRAAELPATFDSLALYFAGHNPLPLFLVFLVGFGMKAGMFPLHVWLPEAHPAAPAHISALMSGVMIKMGVYGILRVALAIGDGLLAVGLVLFVLGIVTGLWGILSAAVQNDLKRLLAYSSIENVGIILLALGIGLAGKAWDNPLLALCGVSGALLHTVNHSFFKGVLFFGAGSVYTATHTTALNSLGGLGRTMPRTAALFLAGTAAICALPPLSGFVSEFLVYFGLLGAVAEPGSGTIAAACGIVFLALIGGLALLAFTKLYGITFSGLPRSKAAAEAREVPVPMIAGAMIPLAGILAVGLAPGLFTGGLFALTGRLLGIEGAPLIYRMAGPDLWKITAAAVVLAGVVGLVCGYKKSLLRKRTVGTGPTWGCGFGAPSPRMQYTGESFAEGLQSLSGRAATGRPQMVGRGEIFAGRHNLDVRHRDRVASLFSAWWVELLRRVNARVMATRTGKVNHYVLYALMFLLLILLLSLTNLI